MSRAIGILYFEGSSLFSFELGTGNLIMFASGSRDRIAVDQRMYDVVEYRLFTIKFFQGGLLNMGHFRAEFL